MSGDNIRRSRSSERSERGDENLAYYETLQLVRLAEEKIRAEYHKDEMKTPVHLCVGQEHVVTGVLAALSPDDQILGTYRSHALYLVRTRDTRGFFAELYGRATGPAKGKAGSMHLAAPEQGFLGTSAVVGTTIPLALGAALANKQLGSTRRVAVFFGDGAVDEGVFWESLNFASLSGLPVIFVCEDNGLAIHTPGHERHGYDSIDEIAARYRCVVDGSDTTDVAELRRVAARAIGEADELGRPAFLHFRCYRYLEHVGINEDFDAGYRPRAEYDEWRARDPIELVRSRLIARGTSEGALEAIDRKIQDDLDEAVRLARAAPFPEPGELGTDVFA